MNLKLILLILIVVSIILHNNRNSKRIQRNNINTNKQNMIIIGSGPSVLKKHNGNIIDKFDIVVRFNNFQIDGYEKYVGTKTDYWFINGKNIRTKSQVIINKLKNTNIKNICLEQNPYDTKKKLLSYFPDVERYNTNFMDIEYFNFIQNKFYNKKRMNPHPSLGIQAIYYMCKNFSSEYDVYIYGFDNFDSNKIHYSGSDLTKKDSNAHNTDKEKQVLQFLKQEYNIKYF